MQAACMKALCFTRRTRVSNSPWMLLIQGFRHFGGEAGMNFQLCGAIDEDVGFRLKGWGGVYCFLLGQLYRTGATMGRLLTTSPYHRIDDHPFTLLDVIRLHCWEGFVNATTHFSEQQFKFTPVRTTTVTIAPCYPVLPSVRSLRFVCIGRSKLRGHFGAVRIRQDTLRMTS